MQVTDEMVDRFLTWALPASVCADPCATRPDMPNRSGTNLLTATEARAMLEHVLATTTMPPRLPVAPLADALLALDRIATRVAEAPDGYLECVNIARRVLREFPIDAYSDVMAAWKDEARNVPSGSTV